MQIFGCFFGKTRGKENLCKPFLFFLAILSVNSFVFGAKKSRVSAKLAFASSLDNSGGGVVLSIFPAAQP